MTTSIFFILDNRWSSLCVIQRDWPSGLPREINCFMKRLLSFTRVCGGMGRVLSSDPIPPAVSGGRTAECSEKTDENALMPPVLVCFVTDGIQSVSMEFSPDTGTDVLEPETDGGPHAAVAAECSEKTDGFFRLIRPSSRSPAYRYLPFPPYPRKPVTRMNFPVYPQTFWRSGSDTFRYPTRSDTHRQRLYKARLPL